MELTRLRRRATLKSSCGGSLDRPDSMDDSIAVVQRRSSTTASTAAAAWSAAAQSAMHRRRQSTNDGDAGETNQQLVPIDCHYDDASRRNEIASGADGGAGTDETSASQQQQQQCARCRADLGKIINRGALCRQCELRVCKRCREFSAHSMEWLCCVCHDRQM